MLITANDNNLQVASKFICLINWISSCILKTFLNQDVIIPAIIVVNTIYIRRLEMHDN